MRIPGVSGQPARPPPEEALAVAERAASYFRPRTVALIGSMARGDWTASSDIDLLIVGDDLPCIADFEDACRREAMQHIPSVILYPSQETEDLCREGSLFMYHVEQEAVLVRDDGFFAALPLVVPKENYVAEVREQFAKLRLFADLSRFGEDYTIVFSRLFSILKNVCMFTLAGYGQYEFNKSTAIASMRRYSRVIAEHEHDLAELNLFYQIAMRRAPALPPFPAHSTDHVRTYLHRFEMLRSELAS